MLSHTFETASGDCKFAHLSHLKTILLIAIPAPRINIMNSVVRPRRRISCLTGRGGDPAASGVSSWHRPSASRSELDSSWFTLLDAAMLTWHSLPAAPKEGKWVTCQFCIQMQSKEWHAKRAKLLFFLINLTSSHSFFLPFNLDTCSCHCLFIDNLDSCFFFNAQNNKSMWSRNKLPFQVFLTLKRAVAESHNYLFFKCE